MAPRFRPTAVLLALFAVTAAACDDPSGPCDGEIECDVEGVDLAVITAVIEWTDDQPYNQHVGGHLVQPGDDVTYRFRIVNLGDRASGSAALHVGSWSGESEYIELPTLGPGEVFEDRVTVSSPTGGLVTDQVIGMVRLLTDVGPDYFLDENPTNDHRELRYYIDAPVLSVYLQGVDTLRVGVNQSALLTIVNRSPVAALEGDYAVAFCVELSTGGYPPTTCLAPFGLRDVSDIPPLGWVPVFALLSLPPAFVPLDERRPAGLRACVGPGSSELLQHEWGTILQGSCTSVPIAVIQDLDVACTPATVLLPDTLDANDAESFCQHGLLTYHVWAFEVDSPGLHSLTGLAGEVSHARVFGSDHEPIAMSAAGEFFLAEAGRYHVLVLPSTANHIFAIE